MGQSSRRMRWLIWIYIAGIVLDLALHLVLDLQTGDRRISLGELAVGWQASLFWPVDLVFRLFLLMRPG